MPIQVRDFGNGVAIVAGGSGGIGGAIAVALAKAGANVALTFHSRREAADAIVAEIEQNGASGMATAVEHADPEAMKAFIDDAARRFGRIHSVVYAAGPQIPHNS